LRQGSRREGGILLKPATPCFLMAGGSVVDVDCLSFSRGAEQTICQASASGLAPVVDQEFNHGAVIASAMRQHFMKF
jgi:hypothetical protein